MSLSLTGMPMSGLREINILLNMKHDNIVELMEIAVNTSLTRYKTVECQLHLYTLHYQSTSLLISY